MGQDIEERVEDRKGPEFESIKRRTEGRTAPKPVLKAVVQLTLGRAEDPTKLPTLEKVCAARRAREN